jgi:hypothetical protein
MRLTAIFIVLAATLSGQNLSIPFRFASPDIPLIILDLTVQNTRTLTAVLDTGQGVAPILLSTAAANALQLSFRESDAFPGTFGAGSGAAPRILRTSISSLTLSGVQFPPLTAGVTDSMLPISRAVGQNIDANLGYAFLKDYTVTVNYGARRLTLSRQRLASGQPVSFGPRKPLAILECRINGAGPFRFAVDTGASSSAISLSLAQRLRLPRGMAVPMMGASGQSEAYMTSADSFEFGNRTFRGFQFASGAFFEPLSAAVGVNIDGVLGANAFQGLALTIDYPGRKLALTSAQQ